MRPVKGTSIEHPDVSSIATETLQRRAHRAELFKHDFRFSTILLDGHELAAKGEKVVQLVFRCLWSEAGDVNLVNFSHLDGIVAREMYIDNR